MPSSESRLQTEHSLHRAARVKDVTRTWVKMPLRALAEKHLLRQNYHYCFSEVCTVTLDCGIRGIGETMPFYTWGRVTDHSIKYVMGKSAVEVMWDDAVGPGLQQAMFDAVGKLTAVPVHHLIGRQARRSLGLSWWAIDMPGEDWAEECHTALQQGYTSMKVKCRPWYDPKQQLQVVGESVPSYFRLAMDFNGTLPGGERGYEILAELSRYPNTDIFEEPLPVHLVEAYRQLVCKSCHPIVLHGRLRAQAQENKMPVLTAAQEGLCNGFVLSYGGATAMNMQATLLAELWLRFWLQILGTGITASFLVHLGVTMSHLEWPSVTCHQLFEDDLVEPRMVIRDGRAEVSEEPGLGVELNEYAIERYRIAPLTARPYPIAGQLVGIRWPSGGTSYYAHRAQYWEDFATGRLPGYIEGVTLDVIGNDGTATWEELQWRAANGGVHLSDSPI